MYNILVFGLKEHRDAFSKNFNNITCNFLYIDFFPELCSTAFSRIFDTWILRLPHSDIYSDRVAELLTASGAPPHIFICTDKPEDSRIPPSEKFTYITEYDFAKCAEIFSAQIRDKRQRDKERYLAGYIQPHPGLEALVSKSPLVEQLSSLVKNVAPTESPLLLIGETGTGKELLANIYHNESRRKHGPFMAVNCGALPDTLLESELFGYEKGAFTGASTRHTGKIEHAAGGTLFLDEIEAMSPAMQTKLLRVLQEKSLQRLGGNIEIHSDFRIISATNTDPLELLNSGSLRSDLYYRISVFQIHLPPLRDRPEDIPLLVQHFINKIKVNGRDYVKGLDRQAMDILLAAPWFGNVRELQNVIERAVILASSHTISADLIQIPGLPLADTSVEVEHLADNAFRPGTSLKSYKNLLIQSAERKYLAELLDYTGGRVGDAAQLADLTPRALYNKMKMHGLKKEDFKKSAI